MGRTKHSAVSGKVANLIYYEYRGKPCCRSAPETVRQTVGMKKSASQFGLAVRLSKYLRRPLNTFFPDAKDKALLYGFNNAIMKWLRELKPDENTFSTSNFFIDQFQFNESALLPVLVMKPINTIFSGPGGIIIDIPELVPGKDIIAPEGTLKLHWRARVTSCGIEFDRRHCYQVETQTGDKRSAEAILEYEGQSLPPQRLSLHLKQQNSALTIVALRLQYETKKYGKPHIVADKEWAPAGVVGSCFGVGQ
jgi:hypothetical protein